MAELTLDRFIRDRLEWIREQVYNDRVLDLDDMLYLMDHDPELYLEYERRMGGSEF